MNSAVIVSLLVGIGVSFIGGCQSDRSAAQFNSAANAPIVCTLTQEGLAERKDEIAKLTRSILERRDLANGIAYRFAPEPGVVVRLARLVDLERQCCQLLTFRITVEAAGSPVWLELTGPPAAKAVIEGYFGHGNEQSASEKSAQAPGQQTRRRDKPC